MNSDHKPTPTPTASVVAWQQAKATTQAVERRISSNVDPADVASVTQMAKGSLFSCTADTWQWSGGTTITLKSPNEIEPVLAQMKAYWSNQPGFTATSGKDSADGSPTLDIRRGDVEGYLVGLTPKGDGLNVVSFSTCFTLPDDTYPGGEF